MLDFGGKMVTLKIGVDPRAQAGVAAAPAVRRP